MHGVAKVPMKTLPIKVVPIAGDHRPPPGIAIGCAASPIGPQLTIVLSSGEQALCALIAEADLDAVFEQWIAAAEKAGTMHPPKPEPEVRR